MSDELLINVTPQETRIATIENGMLQEVLIERACKRGLVGNIYKAKVARVLPGMQAAFLDIGLERTAFLHLNDIDIQRLDILDSESSKLAELNQELSINHVLQEGQELIVQVIKDPISSKGARLTTHITIPARFLVFMPNSTHIGISQRLTNNDERERLKATVLKLQSEFGDNGYIIRTVAEGISETEIYSDMQFLNHIWQSIIERSKEQKSPYLIHEDLALVMRMMRDLSSFSSLELDLHG